MRLWTLRMACRSAALAGVMLASAATGQEASNTTASLAVKLAREKSFADAALEFRRAAMQATNAGDRAAYYWVSSYHYMRACDGDVAEAMLDKVEDTGADIGSALPLLRAENAGARRKYDEAAFYLDGLTGARAPQDVRSFAARRLAVARLKEGRSDAARQALALDPATNATGVAAIDRYARGRDKSPLLGGALGLIPGMGYAYAGEYGNAARSIILNGLFIFGMAYTAKEDQWGGFAVITFGELTWYSGSIYGGIDSTVRYNQTRFTGCADEITGKASFEPELDKLPLLSIRFSF